MNFDDWTPAFRGAVAALVLAVVLTGWVLVRATAAESIPDAAPTLVNTEGALAPPGFVSATDIQSAVANDPFVAERTAPPVPYRMPGEDDAEKPTTDTRKLVVLGTAVGLGGTDFVTCRLGDDFPRIMHVGDKIGEYTIKTIERERVVFTTAQGERLEVAPLKTGS